MIIDARSVLVVVAHPDDEVLGCGGLLARMIAACKTVVIAADGETSRASATPEGIADRNAAMERVQSFLGFDAYPLGFADQRLDTVPLLDLTQRIEAAIRDVHPDLVVTHWPSDLNLDHALVARATLTACRPMSHSPVRTVLGCETPSATEWGFGGTGPAFPAQVFVPIDPDVKVAAMKLYGAEMRKHPHPRSEQAIRALATWRGAQIGRESAEAFALLWRREA